MLRLALIAAIVVTSRVDAQTVITYDTVSAETGSTVSCGFCTGEKFGVVFRELEMGNGLDPEDFPLVLRGIRVVLADASVSGGMCSGGMMGGNAAIDIEVYAGTTPPSGMIRMNPEDGPWDGETLLLEVPGLPLRRSALAGDGMRYMVEFNDLQVADLETEEDIRLEPPTQYIRAVFTLAEGAVERNPNCEAMGLVSPNAFPMRDTDGVIQNERSFIFGANGLGWQWNEAVGLMGDWAIRLEVEIEGTPVDAGLPDAGPMDAGSDAMVVDAGTDASAEADAGESGTSGGGCAVGGVGSAWLFALLLMRRRRT